MPPQLVLAYLNNTNIGVPMWLFRNATTGALFLRHNESFMYSKVVRLANDIQYFEEYCGFSYRVLYSVPLQKNYVDGVPYHEVLELYSWSSNSYIIQLWEQYTKSKEYFSAKLAQSADLSSIERFYSNDLATLNNIRIAHELYTNYLGSIIDELSQTENDAAIKVLVQKKLAAIDIASKTRLILDGKVEHVQSIQPKKHIKPRVKILAPNPVIKLHDIRTEEERIRDNIKFALGRLNAAEINHYLQDCNQECKALIENGVNLILERETNPNAIKNFIAALALDFGCIWNMLMNHKITAKVKQLLGGKFYDQTTYLDTTEMLRFDFDLVIETVNKIGDKKLVGKLRNMYRGNIRRCFKIVAGGVDKKITADIFTSHVLKQTDDNGEKLIDSAIRHKYQDTTQLIMRSSTVDDSTLICWAQYDNTNLELLSAMLDKKAFATNNPNLLTTLYTNTTTQHFDMLIDLLLSNKNFGVQAFNDIFLSALKNGDVLTVKLICGNEKLTIQLNNIFLASKQLGVLHLILNAMHKQKSFTEALALKIFKQILSYDIDRRHLLCNNKSTEPRPLESFATIFAKNSHANQESEQLLDFLIAETNKVEELSAQECDNLNKIFKNRKCKSFKRQFDFETLFPAKVTLSKSKVWTNVQACAEHELKIKDSELAFLAAKDFKHAFDKFATFVKVYQHDINLHRSLLLSVAINSKLIKLAKHLVAELHALIPVEILRTVILELKDPTDIMFFCEEYTKQTGEDYSKIISEIGKDLRKFAVTTPEENLAKFIFLIQHDFNPLYILGDYPIVHWMIACNNKQPIKYMARIILEFFRQAKNKFLFLHTPVSEQDPTTVFAAILLMVCGPDEVQDKLVLIDEIFNSKLVTTESFVLDPTVPNLIFFLIKFEQNPETISCIFDNLAKHQFGQDFIQSLLAKNTVCYGEDDRTLTSPLHLAMHKSLAEIKTLLAYNADPSVKNNNGQNVLEYLLSMDSTTFSNEEFAEIKQLLESTIAEKSSWTSSIKLKFYSIFS